MFNFFKKFKKTNNINKNIINTENSFITFNDLKLQTLHIQVKPNGNDFVLSIVDQKTSNEYVFDNEQCTVLSYIFNEFAQTNKLNNTFYILNKEGE